MDDLSKEVMQPKQITIKEAMAANRATRRRWMKNAGSNNMIPGSTRPIINKNKKSKRR